MIPNLRRVQCEVKVSTKNQVGRAEEPTSMSFFPESFTVFIGAIYIEDSNGIGESPEGILNQEASTSLVGSTSSLVGIPSN